MSEPRWLNSSQDAAWRGLVAVQHRALPEIDRSLRVHGLLSVHFHILVTLSETPGRTMRLSDLANTANLSQSRLTHRLRVLVERGDVEVCADPHDGRAKNATLTATGFERLEAVAPHHVEDVQRLIFDHLTPAQTECLADALSAVAAALCKHPEYLNPHA